ncbi:hypothetical protein AJ85_04105 [Alkalihalobacillus alcalophilus ATCC 27647 = CGMCC 1.3604]|uniref:Uncharacterized protein n=1 Tax=Alkalihalobacillus alcalophilus ATCC 27647 = CGMCC 1.3604 TaxID=1218173 RepID=A0A094XHW5_ALKAL|nr:hypothetical protein [Alkalihalobacillus alcalophilus]KGA98370.1 hypothetical protein BALCAV_0204625 [Alkalihalobacillus alcalophilus ATCC 27647 = CGMCC 1.3604]MED1563669.1 hypothetical protein [Alkalihalobacillus alcalophilus]THG91603.1 hypothetical protein AJ85_04105 [Alkalihalobacillus alcalophilus ATCC 27647 = CGMCC 1.3604]
MIIEVDGCFFKERVLLKGKRCTMKQLRQKYFQVKSTGCQLEDLPNLFCRIHSFEKLVADEDLEVDFVIDLDTDRIYAPRY